jgi:hypothetical protein
MTEIKLEEWNLDLPDNFSMLVYGSRRAGKSTMVRYIVESNNLNDKFDHIVCISTNHDTLNEMSEYISGNLQYSEFNPTVLKNLCKISEECEVNNKAKKFLIILDDINNDARNDKTINNIYATGRHFNASIIIISQHVTSLSPNTRNNSDIILIGRVNTAIEKKCIIENFLLGARDEDTNMTESEYKFYRRLIKKYTSNFNFIVIDNTTMTNEFDDMIKYVKAELE